MSSHPGLEKPVYPLFVKAAAPALVVPTTDSAAAQVQPFNSLSGRLPLPPTTTKLTRSEQLFSAATRVNPKSLTIDSGDEFFLFMELRREEQWTSYGMTSHKWVEAANTYNRRLQTVNQSKGLPTIPKNPRALMDKLGEIEPKIINRLTQKNFVCECHTL
jgi:hypothetical protein